MRWERYLSGMKEQGLLRSVILILALGLVIEGYLMIQMINRQRVVLVPPGVHEAGEIWVRENNASAGYLEDVTRFLLPLVTSFHPRTLTEQISLFLRYVAPEQYGAVKALLLSQAGQAIKNDISQAFYIQEVEIKKETARATGILRRYVGKTRVTEEVTTYEVRYEIRRGRPVVVGIESVSPARVGASDDHRP